MMDTVIILMVVLAVICSLNFLLCCLAFLCQFGVFVWLFFRGLSGSVVFEAEKRRNSNIKNTRLESAKERAEAGQITEEDGIAVKGEGK